MEIIFKRSRLKLRFYERFRFISGWLVHLYTHWAFHLQKALALGHVLGELVLDCCFRQSGRNRKWTVCSRLQWVEMQVYFTKSLWYLKWCCNQMVSNCIGFLFVCFASADNHLWKLWICFRRHFDESDETKPQVLDEIHKPKSCSRGFL